MLAELARQLVPKLGPTAIRERWRVDAYATVSRAPLGDQTHPRTLKADAICAVDGPADCGEAERPKTQALVRRVNAVLPSMSVVAI